MEERVSLQELAQGLSLRKNTTKREAENFLRTFFEVAEEFTLKEGVVRIKAFGTFKLLTVDSRESVDISTGERIVIDPHSRVTFTPSTALRDAVNKPFSDFQTVVLSDETPTSEMEYVPEEQPAEAPVEEPAEQPQAEEANPNNDMNEQEEQPQPAQQGRGTTVVNQSVEEMQVNAQYVENQTIQQVVSSAVSEELAKRKRMMISRGGIVAWVLVALLLMLAAFLFGYVCAGGTISIGQKPKPQAEQAVKSQPKPKSTNTTPTGLQRNSRGFQPTVPAPKPQPKEEENYAEKYPQVEGGEYWITGTKEEHVMVAGDNLYNLARKAYGDKELAVYIIKYNAFENPNNILLGQKIKLPELKRKE